MNRREEARKQQWALWRDRLDYQPTHTSAWHDGFNAAWEALMAEFRPLITDLRTNAEIGQHFLSNKPWLNEAQADAKAVERLRELVREGE